MAHCLYNFPLVAIIPQLRRLMPQLLTLGEFQPDERTGPGQTKPPAPSR